MKTKKDRIFVIVLAIVAGNLAYQTLFLAVRITGGQWSNLYMWLLVAANVIAFAGILWLIRSYRRSGGIVKKQDEQESSEEEPPP